MKRRAFVQSILGALGLGAVAVKAAAPEAKVSEREVPRDMTEREMREALDRLAAERDRLAREALEAGYRRELGRHPRYAHRLNGRLAGAITNVSRGL